MRLEPLRELQRRLQMVEAYRESLIATRTLAELTDDDLDTVEDPLREVLGRLRSSLPKTQRRMLDYSSIVIQLYGATEVFVERLVSAAAQYLNVSIDKYSDLPQRAREGHRRVSLSALSAIQQSRYRGEAEFSTIVASLDSCEQDREGYDLNVECFAQHTANVRRDVIQELFSALGFADVTDSAGRDARVVGLLEGCGRAKTVPFFHLDDLADRRNEIAHGSVSSDLIALDELKEYVQAVGVVCEALFDSVLRALLEVTKPPYAEAMGVPFKTFRSDRIACFNAPREMEISVGARLAWRHGGGEWVVSPITSLQVDRDERASWSLAEGKDFGAGLVFGCRPTDEGCWVVTM